MEHKALNKLIETHGLPPTFDQTVKLWYEPLAKEISALHQNNTLIIGVQGAQGSGKSTLASFLKHILSINHNLSAIELSLDDFYLPYHARQALAENVHPLFKTRGVPGTHDVELAINTITSLRDQKAGETTRVPRFNKAIDDRCPETEWENIVGPIDVIIFEGWCVGIKAQTIADIAIATNTLESLEDTDAIWRTYVNNALAGPYQDLFNLIEKLAVLNAPSFECVYEWRGLQEQKLIKKWQDEHPNSPAKLLDKENIKRFISHYERLTRHCIATLPSQADWLLQLNTDHNITQLRRRRYQ